MISRHERKWLAARSGLARLWWLGVCGRLLGALGLRHRHNHRLARLLDDTGLFDREWYLRVNADVACAGIHPVYHYVRHGDREGRAPMPLFDPIHYRAHAGETARGSNALLHYAWVGRYRKVSTSPWFDTEYYLRLNRDVARLGVDPLLHYISKGGREGRAPCAQFDAAWYLGSNPDVQASGENPLLHYLEFGRVEGRPVAPPEGEEWPDPVASASALLPSTLDDIAPRVGGPVPCVDVVVPVYRGLSETARCLRSVLSASADTPFELVVVDDASPEPELAEALGRWASAGLFTLLRNPLNVGFVASCNRGIELHPDRDVVLLNSDTEVFGDWLDRLRRAAHRDSRNGTVTPLSNNATIASYPRFLQDNPYPLEISYAELDALAARVNAGEAVEAPTGVGFCMYFRRDCLQEIGILDEEAFGRGYGEENEFSQRAISAGWRNLIAADTFVHHLGSVSFQGERAKRVANAMRVMDRLYPAYQRDVRDFIERDPLLAARERLDRARLGSRARERNVLLVCHNRGGGAERHLREETRRLQDAGQGVFMLRPVRGDGALARLADHANMLVPNLGDFVLAEGERLADLLRALRIDRVQVHGTIDFDVDAPAHIARIAALAGARLELIVHDYQAICPRINLADEQGRYCGEPDERGCDACLVGNGNRYGLSSIRPWRIPQARLVDAAERLVVPNADVSERFSRYFPGRQIEIVPHEPVPESPLSFQRPLLDSSEPLHVVVIGAIGKVKGFDVLLACAREARLHGLPLRFSVLGYSMDDRRLAQAGVTVSGRYLEREGPGRLAALGPHVVWLPSLWPETYSYTLSMALDAGLPVFAFDLGAIARRLRDSGVAEHLMPLEIHDNPLAMLARFTGFRLACLASEAA